MECPLKDQCPLSQTVQWVEGEPPRFRRSSKYGYYADALRRRPGQWAEYPIKVAQPYSTVQRLRASKVGSFPPDEFEFKHSRDRVYVRYVGREDAQYTQHVGEQKPWD